MEPEKKKVNMNLKKEKSCGCIIIKDKKVLLVFEKNAKFWGFPKGHMEKGENEIQTALREVKEEVGLDVEINTKNRYILNYTIRNEIEKTAVFYIAAPKTEKIQKQDSEIEKVKWCDFDEALNTLTFSDSKNILRQAIEDVQGIIQ